MKSHPLECVVIEIFADFAGRGFIELNLSDIAYGLAGACIATGKDWARGDKAYRTVAEDVLGYMAGQGKLIITRVGKTGRVRDGGYYWQLPKITKPKHEPEVLAAKGR
jgi:hypothetical protein